MKRGQVWIETVIYILIGLALITLVLAFVSPRINQQKEKLIVEQSIESLNTLDNKISEIIEAGPGNRRLVEFGLQRGYIDIKPDENRIVFVINELEELYSEAGSELEFGRVKVISTEGQGEHETVLSLDYSNLVDLKINSIEEELRINPSATPYRFFIENKGDTGTLFSVIDIEVES